MQRHAGWETALHDYLAALSGAVFVWGRLDCALFAAGAVEAMTGVDPAADFRGRYSTPNGAVRALRRYGAGTLEATIAARFGEIRTAFARRGDLVLVDGMVGVCVGADAVFIGETDGEAGLVRFPRTSWQKAWAVG
ncbi:hypothetical protein [uncultured Sphingomonas sp.]|uniref:DUF6950 family protein n=1 Tax=uncultured Sphingomonas sp. TaxID=158754 RepID=UPI0025DBAC1A|nr:hypothetical protein [uncultured Sphingomonas sp.]